MDRANSFALSLNDMSRPMATMQYRYWIVGILVVAAGAVVLYDVQSNLSARKERGTAVKGIDAATIEPAIPYDDDPVPNPPPSEYRMLNKARTQEQARDAKRSDAASEETMLQQDVRTPEEIFVELNNSMDSDVGGGAAAESRRREIEAVFYDLETPGVNLEAAVCSESYCRLEVNFSSDANDRMAFGEIFSEPDNPLARKRVIVPRRVPQEDGSVEATVFVLEPKASREMGRRSADKSGTLGDEFPWAAR